MAPSRSPAATDQWQKTSSPVCYLHKPTGKWMLFLNFSNRRGEKAKRKNGPRFDTKAEAIAGMLSFRRSWEYSHRGVPFKLTETDPVPTSTCAAAETALPAGKP